jgi:hypothetical protein
MGRQRRARSDRSGSSQQSELPLAAAPKPPSRRILEPDEAAKLAIAHRTKPGAPPGHVRLVLTLEIRQALAEQLSAKAIRSGKNLEAVVIEMLEAGAKKWR